MYLLLLAFIANHSLSLIASPTQLSPAERDEITQRLSLFYSPDLNAEVMNQRVPKFDANTGSEVHPNAFLSHNPKAPKNSLQGLAGAKASPEFQKAYCEKFLKKFFPSLNCGNTPPLKWSTYLPNDHVKTLARSWVNPTAELDEIPLEGNISHDAWSDDYWRTQWGQTAYRYAQSQFNRMSYKEAIASFNPISEWESFKLTLPEEISKKVLFWSPAEKYDLTVGDENFTLTQQQKDVGSKYLNQEGDVEPWMGLCHGWAPAALMVNRPMKPVTVKSTQNVNVTWYPNDIKAMVTLAWSNGKYPNNFVGGRCNTKKPETLKNGRLKQQECFDNNPATFHLALGNMIGKAKAGFVYDKTFDYEVWNQPIVAYETTYFNPINPGQKSKNWREVVVPYNFRFKARDRFQSPLTRGRPRGEGASYDDSKVQYIVGAITTVVYLAEIRPDHTPEVQQDRVYRETYTYDLEIEKSEGRFVATGGEWHENSHPDFLWVPQKDETALSPYDDTPLEIDLSLAPHLTTTETATQSSKSGSPLCKVIKALITESTGMDSYRCP